MSLLQCPPLSEPHPNRDSAREEWEGDTAAKRAGKKFAIGEARAAEVNGAKAFCRRAA